ncbi:LCP family protein [Leptothermofonsia sp. ETS-13]|uniref:LCP family protein n=1 Tax=Leptothermofonsia sp. ETS-13 TaxID=3035696 RepID=UPI003B9E5BFB
MISATAGALVAVTLSSTPLMQRKLTAEEASVFAKGDRISTSATLQMPELTRPVNILVLGVKVLTTDVDSPPPELSKLGYHALVNSFDGLTDTMLLLRFNPETKKLIVLSIPRDTRTHIPGYGTAKINAANVYGGPALAAKTTSELLGGIGIDRYATINVQGVQALIDTLGGVNVYVPKDMKYQDDSQHLYINLKAGRQHLNGDQALQLLRFRYDEYGDIGRIQRQQLVMRALMEQSLNPATLTRLPKILQVIQSYIDTNLTVEELVALVGFASRTSRADVQMLVVPGDFSEPGQYDASYWLPNPTRIEAVMAQYFDFGSVALPTSSPSSLRIAVQDSTKHMGASQLMISALRKAGYSNAIVDLPHSEPLRVTRIVAQQGDEKGAEAIRRAIGLGEVRIESTGELGSDITIQLGQDWIQKQPNKATDL